MKVVVFGASGIIGQHMVLCVPEGVQAEFFRRESDRAFMGCDLTDPKALGGCLNSQDPDVVVNLAGESNTDAVERNPAKFEAINIRVPTQIAAWCRKNGARYIHISSQAVFSGNEPPYSPGSPLNPINEYGKQKAEAERALAQFTNICTIVRPTFVLGFRPIKSIGRTNPAEQMLAGPNRQVGDRFFSPLFARDAARGIWGEVIQKTGDERIVHLGNPLTTSRCDVASALGCTVEYAEHDDFQGIAPRPIDTTYGADSVWFTPWAEGIEQIKRDRQARATMNLSERAREIALFLTITEEQSMRRLMRGFGLLHADVRDDFRASAPADDAALLDWYRKTEAYIWELSAYHCDPGFNYAGMCKGMADRLAVEGSRKVLCLGDGIGDLTLALRRAGFDAVYHDLAGSRTAEFAQFRFWMHGAEGPSEMTQGWEPKFSSGYDAVISFDFLEHVTDVPAWVAAIKGALKPNGLFFAQNAFACGSGPNGSIPCHLERNDRYEKDWTPLVASLDLQQIETSNWYRRAA